MPFRGKTHLQRRDVLAEERHVEKMLEKEAELFRYEERYYDPVTGGIHCSKSARDWFVGEVDAAACKVRQVLKL